ncbi:uncharacterized protein LOC129613245 [Condylostylus longicornis]|uniref:uncharacterized protein LOC129613245 n=1 Tax=Condylostylus longicornis TaxID=2530218 RepID=UPI00244DA3BF|nr:uncharacterized protein LOC129613245 [Condylostylus longicornis]
MSNVEIEENKEESELQNADISAEFNKLESHKPPSKTCSRNSPVVEFDDKNQNRLKIEYEDLINEIDNQNKVFNTLKMNIVDKALKPCKTAYEKKELRNLRCILEHENIKLLCLLRKAILVQGEDPTRAWEHISLATTFAEDSMPLQLTTLARKKTTCSSEENLNSKCFLSNSRNKQILLKKLFTDLKCNREIFDDKANLKKIAKMLKNCTNDSSERKKRSSKFIKKQNKELYQSAKHDSHTEDEDRCHFENEALQSDDAIHHLQNKIDLLQNELQFLCEERIIALKNSTVRKVEVNENKKLQSLEHNIAIVENCLSKLKLEMCNLKEDRNQCHDAISKGKDSSFEKGEAEVNFLQEKLCNLQAEAQEYKYLIKEQSEQLLEYQSKYLAAQQKVQEQKCMLSKLEMNNKNIEDQINLEIRRIKEKFQEKLKEYIHLPKLLENEQLKLAAICKEKESLESKLRLVCKELKNIKASTVHQNELSVDNKCIIELKKQIETFRQTIDMLQVQKKILVEKLDKTKQDLDLLRGESTKIVCKTKERAEQIRSALQQRLDCVEKELAQCRANACVSISDREEIIKQLQLQLDAIACNFETAQNQIRTFKNQITHITNDSMEHD